VTGSTPRFDPDRLFRVLAAHGVRFVLIGGWAAKLRGSPTLTADIDICHDRDPANLERLAAALSDLGIRLRGVMDEVPFSLDARSLRAGGTFTLASVAGDIDLVAEPAGSGGFAALAAGADVLDLDGLEILVASLEDLIAMKRAAGRPKDLIEVEVLEALREETEDRPSSR
jgi:hypothetical protein